MPSASTSSLPSFAGTLSGSINYERTRRGACRPFRPNSWRRSASAASPRRPSRFTPRPSSRRWACVPRPRGPSGKWRPRPHGASSRTHAKRAPHASRESRCSSTGRCDRRRPPQTRSTAVAAVRRTRRRCRSHARYTISSYMSTCARYSLSRLRPSPHTEGDWRDAERRGEREAREGEATDAEGVGTPTLQSAHARALHSAYDPSMTI